MASIENENTRRNLFLELRLAGILIFCGLATLQGLEFLSFGFPSSNYLPPYQRVAKFAVAPLIFCALPIFIIGLFITWRFKRYESVIWATFITFIVSYNLILSLCYRILDHGQGG